ncbi:MAG: hypothetical protein ACYDAS_00030 [Patescibacteria group bacterium]
MQSIFVISRRFLGVTVLFFAVFLVLSSVSAKPTHALIVGGGGTSGGSSTTGSTYFYYECPNSNGSGCSSTKSVSSGSVGLNVKVYDVSSNGTQSVYSGVGVSIKGSPYGGRTGVMNSLGHVSYEYQWGPSYNYWFTGNQCPSRCWDFVNGYYAINQGKYLQYPSQYTSPTGSANSAYYESSGKTNSNGVYSLSPNGSLDCGFSPFTLSITPPSSYSYVTINGVQETSMSGLNFSNGTTYNYTVKIYTSGSPPTSGCSITVSANPSSVAKGSYTILTINETNNGSPVSGDTLKITSNSGTPTKTNPTTNSSGISNPTEYDPGSPPNTVIFTVASGKYSNCSNTVTVKWGSGGCSITVSAKPTNPASGSYTIFTIHETYNGSNVSGDTLKITSNSGTPTKTNPTTNSLGVSNPTEYDPGSSPNTVIFTVASGKYSNCSGKVTVSWGSGSSTCSISVSASPSNPTVGGATTLGITEKLNGVLAPNGDTLDISSNAGSVSTSSVVYSGSPTNVSENDPSSSPSTPVTFTVKSTKYANCSGSTTVNWSGLLCTSGGSAPGCEPPVQPVCVGGTNGAYGGAGGTTQRNYKQLVINGSLIGYNGIYDYRDLGGCDPFYPAVKILYNLKYISLYNVNFLKLIGNNLEIWQEEGI